MSTSPDIARRPGYSGRASPWRAPHPHAGALAVWRRNVHVWRRLLGPSLFLNFGEPFIYLLGLGFGLGLFIGDMAGMPYLTFLASGLIASSAMNTASFEAMYSVFTRMVPQQTYDAMLATPLEVDDIVAGEMLWCATKGLISSTAILVVATLLGAFEHWSVIACLPVLFLVGFALAGPALVVTALSPSYDFFNYYTTLFMTPMFIFSGVFYPVTALPGWLQGVVQILPLTHAIALLRPLAAGQPLDAPLLHLAVLLIYAAAGLWLATALVRRRLIQ